MLTTILGNLGSGKTLLMVILAYYQKRKIVTNFDLFFDEKKYQIEKFDRNKFIRAEYEDCLILLDEAYNYLESRVSNSKDNRIFSYILFQSRKKSVELYITAQIFSSLDKRFRQLSDIYILANYDKEVAFNYTIINKEKNRIDTISFSYQKVLTFFELYDTLQLIEIQDKKVVFESLTPDQKLEKTEEYVEEIRKYYIEENKLEKVTRSMIELYVKNNSDRIPEFLIPNIFAIFSLEKKLQKQKDHTKKSKKVK